MNINFYTRNNTPILPSSIKWKAERYSWNMIGGPETCSLSAPVTPDKWDAAKLLRCPVEIVGQDGIKVWWGYVHKVIIPHETHAVGLSIDSMWNRVSVMYSELDEYGNVVGSQQTTTWVDNLVSQSEYGIRENLVSLQSANLERAEARRATELGTYQYPLPLLEAGSSERVVLECRGWWKTLEWKYYYSTAVGDVASSEESTDVLKSILEAAGQFFTSVLIYDASGVFGNYRFIENPQRAAEEIKKIMTSGDANGAMLLTTVTPERAVIIYKMPAENVEYYMRPDGQLETIYGQVVPADRCTVGHWATLKNVPQVLGGMSAFRPFFIEWAEYLSSSGSTQYRILGVKDLLDMSEAV